MGKVWQLTGADSDLTVVTLVDVISICVVVFSIVVL